MMNPFDHLSNVPSRSGIVQSRTGDFAVGTTASVDDAGLPFSVFNNWLKGVAKVDFVAPAGKSVEAY